MERPAKEELKKGPWTKEEDQKLLAFIQQHGQGSWRSLPAKAGLQRCGKSCRLRWTNYLRPDIKRGKFSTHEEKIIIRLHALLGNRWSAIAAHLPKRTDNEIKNYWNTRLKKRLTRMGIDPVTHKPKNIAGSESKHAAKLSHMAQWEAARLEAEARLARESKFLSSLNLLQRSAIPPQAAQPCLDVLKAWQATGATKCFFGSLESPTSTLAAVPAVEDRGRMDISAHANYENLNNPTTYPLFYGGCDVSDAADRAVDGYSMSASGSDATEVEETRNYWNELLNIVTNSAMELPGF